MTQGRYEPRRLRRRDLLSRWVTAARVRLAVTALVVSGAVSVAAAMGESPRARTGALYNLLSSPHAAFVWFPNSPHPGEPVLLASVSNDLASPITGFAWDLGQGRGFESGGPTLMTAFTTFASRVVRLRVTNGNGLSDVAVETIQMSSPPATVLQPFPLVRIVGIMRRSGVLIRVLAVQAGPGAKSAVTCHGRGCPLGSASRTVPSTARGALWLRFRRLERFLPAGVVLEIRVSRQGKIGSYTRFRIRQRKLPSRVDTCLDTAGVKPITCPSA